jgi:hypothetical protein
MCSPRFGGWEEASQQLVDSFRIVVMNPVRGVRQPLDTLEARNVVVLGLGQFFLRGVLGSWCSAVWLLLSAR